MGELPNQMNGDVVHEASAGTGPHGLYPPGTWRWTLGDASVLVHPDIFDIALERPLELYIRQS
jgi:hypothetical protein